MDKNEARSLLADLFNQQSLAVLATSASKGPYTTLVGFVASKDLKRIYFATTRSTRKYAALTSHPEVSMLIDSRSNSTADFRDAVAVTALGEAREIDKQDHTGIVGHYLAKHPHLSDFISSPTCALIQVTVDSYIVVTRFQQVVTLDLTS
jgi:uncharacterized protein YhbP (UPF0306 family)